MVKSFYPALSNVIGAGKSTLLKIISDDFEDDYEGEVFLNDVSVGYLPQEPELDPEKNVRENIFEGVPEEKKELLEEYVEVIKSPFSLTFRLLTILMHTKKQKTLIKQNCKSSKTHTMN